MKDYTKAKIYKIINFIDKQIYVGSTIQPLVVRMARHIYGYKSWKSRRTKQYCSSFILFENHGFDNCKIVLLENFSSSNKKELNIREEFYRQKNIEFCVNKRACYQTAEGAKKKKREWNEKNKEKNKVKNKVKNWKKSAKRYICECGVSLQLRNKRNHLKSKIHQKYFLKLKKYNIQQKKHDIQFKKLVTTYYRFVKRNEKDENVIMDLTFSKFYFKLNSNNKKIKEDKEKMDLWKKKEKIIKKITKQSKKRFNSQFKDLLKTYDRFVKRNEKYENVIMDLTFSQYYFRFGSWYRK